MKIVRWIIAILIFGLAFFWASRVNDYFFSISSADQLGFLTVMLVGIIFFDRLSIKVNRQKTLLIVGFLLLVLFTMYPIISWLILFTNLGWLVVYVFVLLTSFSIVYLFHSKLLLLILVGFIVIFYMPYEFRQEQLNFYDRVESSIETRMGEAQVVRWKKNFWLYYNKQFQFSTLDRHMYQEAYVQPAMQLIAPGSKILLIGGDNGIIEDELAKFEKEVLLTILIMDREFYDFSRDNLDISTKEFVGKEELSDKNIFEYLDENKSQFDLIVIDVPDPVNLDFSQYYTVEFYELASNALTDTGFLVSQSGDFYKNGAKAHQIWNSVEMTGLNVLPLQCQIPTIGQWSWVIGSKEQSASQMKDQLSKIEPTVTSWWNQDAANLMMSFGKNYFSEKTEEVNYLVIPKLASP